jgi:exopolysaccharide biosynthesis polyprenyl glycosylphosphotransferase
MSEAGVSAAAAAEVAHEANRGATVPVAVSAEPLPIRRGGLLERETTFRRLLGIADAFAITLALAIAAIALGGAQLTWLTLAVPPLFVLVAKAIGLYDRDQHLLHKTTLDEVPALFALASLSVLLLSISDGLLVEGGLDGGQIAAAWGALFVLLLVLRSLARYAARELSPTERCLFVGDAASAEEFREKLATSHAVKAELVGWIPAVRINEQGQPEGNGQLPLAERIKALIADRDVHRVVLGPGPARSEELLDSVRQSREGGVKVSVLPIASRVVSSSVELDRLNGLTLLGVKRFEITHSSRFIKRAFDLVGSTLALILLSPLLLLVASAIRLDSRGPAVFRQRRAGRHGEPFEMLKFRSMEDGADQRKDDLRHLNEADGVFKIADDPRITRVGRLIRRLHLDELPQLVNVVRGEMSLVGPRPLPLDEDRRIEGWHRRRLDLRPGITGPWQVLGSSRIPVREMVRLDYQYVADWSLWNDIRILLLTVPHVVRRRGL